MTIHDAMWLAEHYPVTLADTTEYVETGFNKEVCVKFCELRALGFCHREVMAAMNALLSERWRGNGGN